MALYPIAVKRNPYRGAALDKKTKAQAENQLASKIEARVNQLTETQTEHAVHYLSKDIAIALGIGFDETFRKLCKSIDGGYHGFTVVREDLPKRTL